MIAVERVDKIIFQMSATQQTKRFVFSRIAVLR